MSDLKMNINAALAAVPVNIFPLIDDTDFKTRETGVLYNQAGMDLVWNFITRAGDFVQTAVTPTTGGAYDWVNRGDAMYSIEIPATGGASINNNVEGYGWFTGICGGVLAWRGPVIYFGVFNNEYQDGAVWIDTVNGVPGTVQYVNGLPTNPCNNFGPAFNLATNLGLNRFRVVGDASVIAIGTSDFSEGFEFITDGGADLTMDTPNVSNCSFRGFDVVSINDATATGGLFLYDCWIGHGTNIVNLPAGWFEMCTILDNLHLSDAGKYVFNCLETAIEGNTDTVLDFDGSTIDPGASEVIINHFSGRLIIKNMKTTDSLEIMGEGKLTFDSSCNSATATALVGGNIEVTNSATALDLTDETTNFKTKISKYLGGWVYISSTVGAAGAVLGVNGTMDNPVNNWGDAKTLATLLEKKIALDGQFINITDNLGGYRIKGIHGLATLDGDNTTRMILTQSIIEDIKVTGGIRCQSTTKFYRCNIGSIDAPADPQDGLNGECYDCILDSNIYLMGGVFLTIKNGASQSYNPSLPNLKFHYATNTGSAAVVIYGFKGQAQFLGMNNGADRLNLYADAMEIWLDSTITAGTIRLVGTGKLVDNKTAATLDRDDWVNNEIFGTPVDLGSGADISSNLEDINQGVGNVSIAGAAINQIAESFVLTSGNVVSGSVTNTEELDGSYHQIEDVAGVMDFYYRFDVGPTGVPISIVMTGRAMGVGDDLQVYAYDWVGASWGVVGPLDGQATTTDDPHPYNLFQKHVGTGANLGKVRIRFAGTGLTSADFYNDQVFVSYSIVNQSVGYDGGAIWVDTNASNTNTVIYVDGTADNPVSTWAAALNLNTQLGLNKFRVKNGSTISLSAASDNYTVEGNNWAQGLNGQSVSGAKIEGATVSGNDDGSNAVPTRYLDCIMGNNTLGLHRLIESGLGGDIVLAQAGTYDWIRCDSRVAGTATPSVDFGAVVGDVNLNMRNYSGGIEIKNMGQAGTDNLSLEGRGQLVINANSVGGTIALRGNFGPITGAAAFIAAGGAIVDLGNITGLQGKTAGAATYNRATASLEGIRAAVIHSLKKATAVAKFKFVMLDSTTGEPEPGLSITAVKKLDAAAAWTALTNVGTIVDNGSGVYSIDISVADTNGNTGVWKFTASGAKDTLITFITEA